MQQLKGCSGEEEGELPSVESLRREVEGGYPSFRRCLLRAGKRCEKQQVKLQLDAAGRS